MAETTPFTQAYATLWKMLLSSSGFRSAVPIGNCIRYTDVTVGSTTYPASRNPEKASHQPADAIEVAIVQSGFVAGLYDDSSESTVALQFEIRIRGGERKLAGMFDLQWIIYLAMIKWDSYLENLMWLGRKFVTQCRPLKASTSKAKEAEANAHGWITVWSGEVHCRFDNTILRAL